MTAITAKSYYARTPSDMRLLREIGRQQWIPGTYQGLYVGCAYGDDLYSWVPVLWGTGRDLFWHIIDVEGPCVETVKHTLQGIRNCRVERHDYRILLCHTNIGWYDIIVANRVWYNNETSLDENEAGMRVLLAAKPRIIFARGHGLHTSTIKTLAREYGYHAYLYGDKAQDDDITATVTGYVWARDEINAPNPHTAVTEI